MSSQGKKKWKWKQTLLGDVLHKGVWRWQHLSEGRDHRTCSWDIRELLKDTTQTKKKSIFSLNLLKKAKSSDIQTWKYFFKNFHSLFDGPTCLNKHYRSIHGAAILKGGPFSCHLTILLRRKTKFNHQLIFYIFIHVLIHLPSPFIFCGRMIVWILILGNFYSWSDEMKTWPVDHLEWKTRL